MEANKKKYVFVGLTFLVNMFKISEPGGGSVVVISWGLVCTHISPRFDTPWELNYHYLTSLGLSFGSSGLHGGP